MSQLITPQIQFITLKFSVKKVIYTQQRNAYEGVGKSLILVPVLALSKSDLFT